MVGKIKQFKYEIAAMLIPVIIMLIIFAGIGMIPFGEKSILTIDMNGQYVSFFSYIEYNHHQNTIGRTAVCHI